MPTVGSTPFEFPVQLGDRYYQIDPKKFSRQDLPALRQQVDTGEQAGAQTLSLEGSWTRGATDWTMGDSQETYDLPSSDQQRYGRSSNTQSIRLGRFTLSPALQSRSTARAAQANAHSQVVLCSGYMYFVDSVSGHVYAADISGGAYSAITLADKLVPPSGVGMVATDGSGTVWAITLSDGLYRTTSGASGGSLTSWTSSSTCDGSVIAFANGRLLIGNNNVISEVSTVPAATVIHTFPTAVNIQGFLGTPGAIYLWGSTKNEIYVMDDVDPTGALSPPRVAAVLSQGEYVSRMVTTSGVMVMSTNFGLRLAVPSGDGSLSLGNIVTPRATPASGAATNILGLAVAGQYVYFLASPSNYGIGRLDLSNFTGPLTPACHSLEVDSGSTSGVLYHVVYYSGGDGTVWVHGVQTGGSGAQIYGFTNDTLALQGATARQKQSTGSRYSGWLTFGLTELKQPVVVTVIHDALPAGATIVVLLVKDDGTEVTLGTQSTTASTLTTFTVNPATITPQRKFQIKLTLTRGTDTATAPVVESWSCRAMPIPQRQEEILLSIVMEPIVGGGDDSNQIRQDLADEYDYLAGLRDARTPVTCTVLGRASTVVVDRVAWPQGEVERMGNDRDEFVGTLYVRLLTVA